LQTLKAEFDALKMKEEETIDQFAGKLTAMSVRYNNLGGTLDDAAMVKKMFDTVPERFLNVVAGIEQFFDLKSVAFDEAVGRLKAFEERTRQGASVVMSNSSGQLLLTQAEWEARYRKPGGSPRREEQEAAVVEGVVVEEAGEAVVIHLERMEEVQEIKAISSVSNATVMGIMQTGVQKQRNRMKVTKVMQVEAKSLKHSCLQKLKMSLQLGRSWVCICMRRM
jgi:FlaA1/EpsC-like NDP-sugar epimerase